MVSQLIFKSFIHLEFIFVYGFLKNIFIDYATIVVPFPLPLHSRKTNNPIKKMGKGLEQTLLQGRHTEGPETYEKMLSITSHQRDAN